MYDKNSKFTSNMLKKKLQNFQKRRDNFSEFNVQKRVIPKTNIVKPNKSGYSTIVANNLLNPEHKKLKSSNSKANMTPLASKSISTYQMKRTTTLKPETVNRSLSKTNSIVTKIGFKNAEKQQPSGRIGHGENSATSSNKIVKSTSISKLICFKRN